ncbi:hypothetical protein [Mangrovihabitans endophyticus]|uniref:Uncharacterized protein n=1 Tax=Mangrovihabitans endophyticus TaxID=1751298 RepID=A0A8J3BZS0_9ACTN|nr:hypothetical protein [Mangrovihabitans endophyticus]GGK89665.1 hypothetical protein GCM10012284_24520 [Mangrovihabitans endophyticus]
MQPTDRELERARWELAAVAGRLRTVEEDLSDWQQRHDDLDRRLLREQKRAQRIRQSRSYRLGQAMVSLVRNPVRASPRLAGAVLRRARGGRAGAPAPRAAVRRVPQRVPAHLYIAIGLEVEELARFLRVLRQRLLVSDDHRPVVLTDNPSFSLLRKHGVLLEYLPDRQTWARHRPDMDWDDLLTDRLSHLHRDYGAVRAVVVDGDRLPSLASLLR